MTIDAMRWALDNHCVNTVPCGDCPLRKWPEGRCNFTIAEDSDYWPDSRIVEAYSAVFNCGVAADQPVPQPTEPSAVDHPTHYNRDGGMECIDEMLMVFGREATMHFCLLNAWKYRYRAADKNGEEDLKKSDWYLAEYKRLKDGDRV